MNDRSVSAGGRISHSIVVTGDGNHASIHFGEGVVLPLARKQHLPKRRRKPTPDNPLPLLLADSLAFDLVGRDEELRELGAWLESEDDISVQTLIGRAGTGKTRLAIELCRRVDAADSPGEAGWRAGFIRPPDLANVVDQLASRPLQAGEPILLVIDYASAVHRELARWFDRLAASDYHGKLRILLLDREAPKAFGWWHELAHPALSGHRADLFADPDRPRQLADLSDIESRRALFGASLQATAALIGQRAHTNVAPAPSADPAFDETLASARFGNPLNLAMAGLIAAETGPREALALRRLEAARFIGRREVQRMVLLGERSNPPITAAAMRHSLGFNGLAGGLPLATLAQNLAAELRAANLTAAMDELPELLRRELPQEGRDSADGAEPRLGTIQPDLVGEAAIVETLLGDPEVGSAQAVKLLRRAYDLTTARCAEAFMRLVQDYGYAAEDPQATAGERRIGEALLLLVSAIADSIPDEEFLRLESLVQAFPEDTLILREAAAAQTRRLADIWKRYVKSIVAPDEQLALAAAQHSAGWRNNLANRLGALGRREEALAAAQEAVELYRRLAAADHDAFTPSLAMSLNNLGNCLSALGRRAEALAAAEEAVGLRRAQAAASPDAARPDLAVSLNNLSISLSEIGRREEALGAAQETVELYRGLAAERPDTFTSELAMSLDNLANRLGDLGRREEALAAAEEAVVLRRTLAAVRPDAFTPSLATSLNNLAIVLSALGQREAALAAGEEAVELYRRLAAVRPDVFTPHLAGSLNTLTNRLSAVGRREDALTTAEEAVELYRRLAAEHPDAFTPNLALSLSVLADRLEEINKVLDAVPHDHEAVSALTPFFHALPSAFSRAMAAYLGDYLRRSEAARLEADWGLVGPIIDKLKSMQEEQGQ